MRFILIFAISVFVQTGLAKECTIVFEPENPPSPGPVLRKLLTSRLRSADPRIRTQYARAGFVSHAGGRGSNRTSEDFSVPPATDAHVTTPRLALTIKKILNLLDPDPEVDFNKKSSLATKPRLLTLDRSEYGQTLYHYHLGDTKLIVPAQSFEFMAKILQDLRAMPLREGFRPWTDQDLVEWFNTSVRQTTTSGRTALTAFDLLHGFQRYTDFIAVSSENNTSKISWNQLGEWRKIPNFEFYSPGRISEFLDFAEVFISRQEMDRLYFEAVEQIVALTKNPESTAYVSIKTKGHDVGTVEVNLDKLLVKKILSRYKTNLFHLVDEAVPTSKEQKRAAAIAHAQRYFEGELNGQTVSKDPFFLREVVEHHLFRRIPKDLKILLHNDAVEKYPKDLNDERYGHVIQHLRSKGYSKSAIQLTLFYTFLAWHWRYNVQPE